MIKNRQSAFQPVLGGRIVQITNPGNSRRRFLARAALLSAGALLARPSDAEELAAEGRLVLADGVSVDMHTHGAGMIGLPQPTDVLGEQMRKGGLTAVCLCYSSDGPIIGRGPTGLIQVVRQPAPGQLYRYHLDRMDWIDRLVAQHGVRRVTTRAELAAAHKAATPVLVQTIEGCDFLDRDLARLDECHRRGVRHLQLVHYAVNDLGDYQTGQVVHGGLTPLGADVVRACNRLGILVDVAHGTFDMVKGVVKAANRPLLLSHTALAGSKAMGNTFLAGRLVTPDHARAVADTGGVLGIWHFFPDAGRYVDGLREMVDVVGVDHVGIGTDQQARAAVLQDYATLPELVGLMLKKGFSRAEAGKIAGGNYARIFAAATGA